AFLDAVLDVGTDPIFDRVAELRTAVHERDLRPRAVELEGGDGGRVLASHHEHGLAVVAVRLRVVMRHVREALARDAQEIGMVVVPRGESDVPRGARRRCAVRVPKIDTEGRTLRGPLEAAQADDLLSE